MTDALPVNQLVMTGQLVKSPKFSQSPAGVCHCTFALEHQSTQVEAGLNRRSYFRIHVVASGEGFKDVTQDLQSGHTVKVSGFLNRHQDKNGLGKLVLHAHQIERISLGDLSHGTLLQTS